MTLTARNSANEIKKGMIFRDDLVVLPYFFVWVMAR